jgi:5-methyltetrahydropteroyltriglutamate--homocysteine methyltransferase
VLGSGKAGEDAGMKRSTDRILTTHVGSLIRPPALRGFLAAKEAGKPFDQAAYAKCLKECVAEVVRKQADIGLDVISDGEFGKAISWAQYALFRLGGFERRRFAGGNPFAASTARALQISARSSTRVTKSKP